MVVIKIIAFILSYMFVAYQLMLACNKHRKGDTIEAMYEMSCALAALIMVNSV